MRDQAVTIKNPQRRVGVADVDYQKHRDRSLSVRLQDFFNFISSDASALFLTDYSTNFCGAIAVALIIQQYSQFMNCPLRIVTRAWQNAATAKTSNPGRIVKLIVRVRHN